jgi:hypothetical protein
MLDFVSRLRDGSVNFVINGIDTWVIDHPEYDNALADEIERATKIGGVAFGMNSNALWLLRGRRSVREFKTNSTRSDVKIFEKVE